MKLYVWIKYKRYVSQLFNPTWSSFHFVYPGRKGSVTQSFYPVSPFIVVFTGKIKTKHVECIWFHIMLWIWRAKWLVLWHQKKVYMAWMINYTSQNTVRCNYVSILQISIMTHQYSVEYSYTATRLKIYLISVLTTWVGSKHHATTNVSNAPTQNQKASTL